MISLKQFLHEEFNQLSPNFQMARENAERIEQEIKSDKYIVKVTGNGNCLIKSIIANILYTRDENVTFGLLNSFIDCDDLLFMIENREQLNKFIDGPIIDQLCVKIKEEINNQWDYCGCVEYHMDENAIDGLAREMVLRFLCVEELIIYSLNPGKEEYKKVIRIDTNTFKNEISGWKVNLICAQGFCHFSAIV